MQGVAQHNPLLEHLANPQIITADDVLKLRRDVFGDGVVCSAEADALFALNDAVPERSAEWNTFFIEALTDYLVLQEKPKGYISEDNADWLMQRIAHDGVIGGACELALLIRAIYKAYGTPDKLTTFALSALSDAVIHGEGPLMRDMHMTPGVIDEIEVDVLKMILYASSGSNGMGVCRQEAEVLWKLNANTDTSRNHESWQPLFVGALAKHLMSAQFVRTPTREEALHREEWLADTSVDPVGFVGEAFSGLFKKGFTALLKEGFKSDFTRMQEAWAVRNDTAMAAEEANAPVDAHEAQWLIDHLLRDGQLDENELALLRFIKDEGQDVAPPLQELIDRYAA